MSAELALACVLGAPILQAALVMLLPRPPGLRDLLHMLGAFIAAAGAFVLVGAAGEQSQARVVAAHPLPNMDLAFSVSPLGALAAALICGLGALHAVHNVGLARASGAKTPARLMALTGLANAGAAGVALSDNLLSMFIAYQVVVMAAFPLVALDREEEGRAASRRFLSTLLLASMGLLLPAIVWTHGLAGAFDFAPGGALVGRVDSITANGLLVLFVLGFAGAATPPVHGWISAASGASYSGLPTLYAIAVLPSGCIGILKVAAFVFGPVLADARIAALVLIALAGVGMCAAALVALARQDLRERMAYSCMAQSLAVVTGALLASPAGIFAAVLQVVALSCAAATLMMALASVAVVTERHSADAFAGLGRLMPWTFASFGLAAASMIGLPPFSGAWAKLWLITASASAGMVWAAVLIAVAATLTFMHLGPLAANAFASRAPADAFKHPDGASFWLVAPVFLGALATLWLLVMADPLANFLSPTWTPEP